MRKPKRRKLLRAQIEKRIAKNYRRIQFLADNSYKLQQVLNVMNAEVKEAEGAICPPEQPKEDF